MKKKIFGGIFFICMITLFIPHMLHVSAESITGKEMSTQYQITTSVSLEGLKHVFGETKKIELEKQNESIGPLRDDDNHYECNKTGYIIEDTSVFIAPHNEAIICDDISWNEEIQYGDYNDNWVIIEKEGGYCFIKKAFVNDKPASYTYFDVSGDRRKSYMDWKCITDKSSPQYKLQSLAYTDTNGVRAVNGRYCIALGSYYTHNVGQYVDLVLQNGEVIPCIIGDCKRNRDTTSNHSVGVDGSVAEFVVETSKLSKSTKTSGDVGDASDGWKSNVSSMIVYNKNIFTD